MGLVEFNGTSTTLAKMITFLKKLFLFKVPIDKLVEGVMAHEYSDPKIREEIKEQYLKANTKEVNPWTDPLEYDPLNPPTGWVYDPYYEIWIKL